MNDLSTLPTLFDPDGVVDEPTQDDTGSDMSRKRTEQGRLVDDSDWSRRLRDMTGKAVAPPRTRVFTAPGPNLGNDDRTFGQPSGISQPTRSIGWADLRKSQPGLDKDRRDRTPLAALDRDGDVSRAFDLLRTRLVHTLHQNGWSRIAVTAPTSDAGTTFTAVNLAISLARVPRSRTVMVDLNLRQPGIAHALNVGGVGEIRHYLSGKVTMGEHMTRYSDTLALALNTQPYADSAELLHDSRSFEVLEQMQEALVPDTVLYDMPAILEYDDLGAFLPQVDGVLLVSDGTRTTARQIAECERILEGQCPLLGVILNRARQSTLRRSLR